MMARMRSRRFLETNLRPLRHFPQVVSLEGSLLIHWKDSLVPDVEREDPQLHTAPAVTLLDVDSPLLGLHLSVSAHPGCPSGEITHPSLADNNRCSQGTRDGFSSLNESDWSPRLDHKDAICMLHTSQRTEAPCQHSSDAGSSSSASSESATTRSSGLWQ